MIKLVCMDLDGTINDNWDLFMPLRGKMYNLKAYSHVEFAIITGRDLLGTLYFVRNSQFPFIAVGTGGGFIVYAPLDLRTIDEVISSGGVEHTIKHGGLRKAERIIKIQQSMGVGREETLYIEDNANGTADIQDARSLLYNFVISTPATINEPWKEFVTEKGGFLSDKPCGLGTLEILNHYFPQ